MRYYLNCKNGVKSIDESPKAGCEPTKGAEMIYCYSEENHYADLTGWIQEKLECIANEYQFDSREEAEAAIFGDLDLMNDLERAGYDHTDYSDLRDLQHSFLDDNYPIEAE